MRINDANRTTEQPKIVTEELQEQGNRCAQMPIRVSNRNLHFFSPPFVLLLLLWFSPFCFCSVFNKTDSIPGKPKEFQKFYHGLENYNQTSICCQL